MAEHQHDIELEQQSHNAEIRQYADNNPQHEHHYQCITCKLLRQRNITVQHKHADTQPIDEIGCQKISSKQGYSHRTALCHGILKALRPVPSHLHQRADENGQPA